MSTQEFAATHKTLEAKRRQFVLPHLEAPLSEAAAHALFSRRVNENYVNPAASYVQAQAKARPIPTVRILYSR